MSQPGGPQLGSFQMEKAKHLKKEGGSIRGNWAVRRGVYRVQEKAL